MAPTGKIDMERRECDWENDLYQSLFVNMIEGFAYCRMIYDGDRPIDFVYLDVNPSFERITGLKGAKGKAVTELIPGVRQANPELFEIYGRVARSRVPECFETYLEALNVWFSISVFSPRLGEFVAVFNDVSTQKRLENELREAKAHAENLIENANAMVVELDRNGKVVALNPAAEQVTGYTAAEIVGQSWFQTIVPKLRYPEVWNVFQQSSSAGLVRTFENPILTKAGEQRYISWSNSHRYRNGNVVGTVSFGIDITESKQHEQQLRETKWQLEEAERIAHVGSWTYDLNTGVVNWSNELFRLLRLDPLTTSPSHDTYMEMVHAEDRAMVKDAQVHFLSDRIPTEITHRLTLPDNVVRHVHLHGELRFDSDGMPVRLVGTVQDVTARVTYEQQLRDSEKRFRTIADFAYDWEYWRGKDGSIVYMTPSCKQVTGYLTSEFSENPSLIGQIIHPDDVALYEEHLSAIHENTLDENIDFRIIRKDGAIRWIAHGCSPVYAHDKTPNGRRVCNRDITDRKEAEERANQLAYFDSLTGLPNRRMMQDRLHLGLVQAIRHSRSMAIMFLDLDNFKIINDTFGHDIGDRLLIGVAQRLRKSIRAGDTVARSGGDEFIIVLPEISNQKDAGNIAEKILVALERPIAIMDHVLHTGVSIGIAVYPDAGTDDASSLMHMADQAMYKAKRAGRNRYAFFGNAD